MPVTKQRRPAKSELPMPEVVMVTATDIQKPASLGKKAALVWDRLVPDLEKSGVLCAADAFLLGQYCHLVATIEELQSKLNRYGYIIKNVSGGGTIRPESRLVDQLEGRLLKLANALGISPAARKALRIKIEKPKKKTDGSSISDLARA